MPAHDWTRVRAGIFHDFHNAWITEIRNALNGGILPPDYYALGEQSAGAADPDVLTLHSVAPGIEPPPDDVAVGTAVAMAPPQVRFTAALEMDVYTAKRRTLVIRHSSDDRIIALIEILSPGNKASRYALDRFVDKAAAVLGHGYHLLLVDLFPPGPRDPRGIHGALWGALGDESYVVPPDKPLTLAAYSAGLTKVAYVEPFAVCDLLKAMPLFLSTSGYVSVPLEESYQAAYRGVPRRWQRVLDSPAA
jgi:hypothetical protein